MANATIRARAPAKSAPTRASPTRSNSPSSGQAAFGAGSLVANGTVDVGAALTPDDLLHLQRAAGNRAVVSALPGVVQRKDLAPAKGTAKPTGAKPGGATPTPTTKLAPRNSYIDLLNAFQDLAAAAINRGGAGLDTVRFGSDLNRAHRSLIWQVRTALIQAQDKDREVRLKAAAWWPSLARKLMAAVEEARRIQLPGESLAAVVDQIAMLNRKYVRARPGKADPEVETAEDYVDSVNAANALLYEFSRMGESGAGIIREEVPGRKDILVSQGVLELNAKQRGALNGVQLGTDLNKRHRKTLDTLRKALLHARAEAPGSAYRALTQFRSIEGELKYIAVRAPTYEVDTAYLKGAIPKTAEALTTHYSWVHQDNIRHALTKERSKEEVKTEQAMKRVVGKGGEAAIKQMRAVQDLQRALEVIERSLVPSPDRPDEWILTSGATVIRVRADQALGIRSTAAKHLKEFMGSLVSAMAEVYMTYDSIKRGNSSFKLKVLGGLGGASDPGDQSSALALMINQRDRVVYPKVDQGRIVDAFKDILHYQEYVATRAKEVGSYDEDLDIGYKRLATIATVVQVALVALVPVAGQAAIASGAGALAVGGTAIVAGSGGAAVAETGRQVATGEDIDPTKIGKAAYRGGVIGAGAIAPVATKQLGTVIAGGGTGTTLVGANALAAGTVGAIHSKLGGGSAGEGFVGGAVGSMAGSAIPALGPVAQRPLTNTLIQGGVGAGTAAITGGDPIAGAVGGISGAIGARVLAPPPGGGAPPPAPTSGDAGKTIPGTGIAPRLPGAPAGPGPGETIPGTGIAPRAPAAPDAGQTLPGVGIGPRTPARGDTLIGTGIEPRAPARGGTQIGTGIDPRQPAAPAGPTTESGTGIQPRPPAGGPAPGGPAPGGPAPGPGTQESIIPAPGPRPARAPVAAPQERPRPKFAALQEYEGRPPLVGRVALILDSPDDAMQLYLRLVREDRRGILGTTDPDVEMVTWRSDGGSGNAPLAWVRAGDGVVRFNFARFQRPDFGGHTTEPFRPIPFESNQAPRTPPPAPAPQGPGGGIIREYARLPEVVGATPVLGPESRVGRVITNLAEAQQLFARLRAERQLNILMHDADFAEAHWGQDGGTGRPVPIAWVRSTDGVIRFNMALFTVPPLAGPGGG